MMQCMMATIIVWLAFAGAKGGDGGLTNSVCSWSDVDYLGWLVGLGGQLTWQAQTQTPQNSPSGPRFLFQLHDYVHMYNTYVHT